MNLAQSRILITNDDGINADGLKVLETIAKTLTDDVWVVAPETEQSGAGHSLTLHLPVRVRQIDPRHYAVSGTPTDCVLLGLREIIPVEEKPATLVLSGINRGSNVGDDVTYSGTVAGAMEGTNLEVASIAFSQLTDDRENIDWRTAQHFAPDLIRQLTIGGWPPNTFININFPNCTVDEVKGVRVCPQGKRLVNVALSERIDPKGRPYYWIGGMRKDEADRPGVDITLLQEGFITVTPLNMDLTDYKTVERVRESLGLL